MGTRAGGVATEAVSKLQQILITETKAALAGAGVFTSPARNVERYQIYTFQYFIQRLAADTNVGFDIQHSNDGVNWRRQSLFTLSVTAATQTAILTLSFNSFQKFVRIVATNNTANALAVTEIFLTLKPMA